MAASPSPASLCRRADTVAALKAPLERTLPKVAGSSSIAQAIRYRLNHCDGLVRFLDDGRIRNDAATREQKTGRCSPH